MSIRPIGFVSIILTAAIANAGDSPDTIPVGSRVMAKRPGVKFRVKGENVGEMYAGAVKRVQKIEGQWLWVGRGWVAKPDVIPLWEAVEYFSTEIDRKPTAFAYVSRARALRERGAYATETNADLEHALKLDPQFAPAYWDRAGVFQREGDLDRAIDDYDAAIRLNPMLVEAYNDRGGAWWLKGQPDKALKDFDEAIRLCPRLASAYANRSVIYLAKGDLEAAHLQAQEALEHDPADYFAFAACGHYWLAKGNDDRAIAAFTEAIRADNTRGRARLERGKIYSRGGDFQKAWSDLNCAVQLLPKSAEALEARAYVHYMLGALEKSDADRLAAARLRQQRSEKVQTDRSPSALADALAVPPQQYGNQNQKSQSPDAKPSSSEAKETSSSFTTTFGNQSSSESRQESEANQLNRAARRKATSTDERYLNGQEAVEQATEACEKTDWKRADFLDTLAAAYAETGDFDAAIKWQTKAIDLSTDSSFKAAAEKRLELYHAHQPCREDRPGHLARTSRIEDSNR
jgi:tetratricopeptide (TPR) repeat protein